MTLTSVRRRVLAGGSLPARVPCPICQEEVDAVTPDDACALLRIGEEAFRRLVEVGLVHAIPTVSGAVWICRRSLFPEAGA
jgi:hypothetical protein